MNGFCPLFTEEQNEIFELKPEEGFIIQVNDDSYQMPLDLSDKSLIKHPELKYERIQFDMPFILGVSSWGRLTGKNPKELKIAPPNEFLFLAQAVEMMWPLLFALGQEYWMRWKLIRKFFVRQERHLKSPIQIYG